MKIALRKVTWYSKLLALILFVALPFVAFYLGWRYGRATGFIEFFRAHEIRNVETIIAVPAGRVCELDCR